jgi:cytochrome c oxidase cbb3-type subunit 3
MIKNVISEIGGVGLYGVISIVLFFVVFTGMLLRAWRMKKSFDRELGSLPLNDGETHSNQKGNPHE